MALDMRTILVITVVISGIIAFNTWQMHLAHRGSIPGTLDWFLSFLLNFIANVLLCFRNIAPDTLSIVVANVLMIFAVCFWSRASARMAGARFPAFLVPLLPAVSACYFLWFSLVDPSLMARALAISAFTAAGALSAALYLWKSRRPELRGGIFLFSSLFVLLCTRLCYIIFNPYRGNWMTNVPVDTLFMLLLLVLYLGMGFVYLRMIDSLVMSDLRRSNEENQLLFREMRHRTKNNLALISSLVSLQKDSVSDADARAAFGILESRLRTIATVYNQLSATPSDQSASASNYLSTVIAGVRDGLAAGRLIAFRTELATTPLDQTVLVPLGLILNELVINAVKYAFPASREGAVISVLFSDQHGNCELRVEDNGIGMPEVREGGGIGLSLVSALASQLRGSVDFRDAPGGGTLCLVSFPLPEK